MWGPLHLLCALPVNILRHFLSVGQKITENRILFVQIEIPGRKPGKGKACPLGRAFFCIPRRFQQIYCERWQLPHREFLQDRVEAGEG